MSEQNIDYAWIVCDVNKHPHPLTNDCRNPEKPDKAWASWLILRAEAAEKRSHEAAERAKTYRAVAAMLSVHVEAPSPTEHRE